MKKLNNKGFAISTMLYGILTIIVIILMLLLNIMRSSYNKENATTDEIYYYLNKCVSKQIALEKCYKTYNVDPSDLKSCADEYEAYTSCAGKNINTNLDKKYLNTTLIDKSSIKGSGIINDPTVTNRFIFVGINPNNYININGEIGRIISVEPAGSIKVLLTSGFNSIFDPSTTTDIGGVGRWETSTLYNTFNNKFNSFDKKNYFDRGRFHMAVIYNNDSTFEALQKIRSNTDSTEAYFGLPSLEDFLKASENILEGGATYCNLNDTTSYSISDTFINCRTNNWMNNASTCAWTSTGYSGTDEYITYSASLVTNKPVTTKCNSNMVVFLSRNTTISSSGEGSVSNPYIVE